MTTDVAVRQPHELEQQFDCALKQYGAAIRRIARIYGRAAGDEDDLQQEILVAVWRGLPKFRGDSSLGTWVYRVALNTALQHRRKQRRRPLLEPASDTLASSDRADDSRQERVLLEFIDTLGPLDRAILLLYMDGRTHAEIGEVTGLSVTAVGVRIHRVKQAFKHHVRE